MLGDPLHFFLNIATSVTKILMYLMRWSGAMNILEILLTFGYVMFATGLISLGCYLTARIEPPREFASQKRKLEIVMTNLEDTAE